MLAAWLLHRYDRARGPLQNALGHASHPHPLHGPTPVSSHHDQVDPLLPAYPIILAIGDPVSGNAAPRVHSGVELAEGPDGAPSMAGHAPARLR